VKNTTNIPAYPDEVKKPRNPWVIGALGIAISFIVAMWIYAFFFAPEVGVNRIDDRAWAKRAEASCSQAKTDLQKLADYRRVNKVGPNALAERADIVEKANTILAKMLDSLADPLPTDVEGRKIIPLWLEDYHTYLTDRVTYVAHLRAGNDAGFGETEINGNPISNFLGDVARQNNMPSCQAPLDLAN